MRVVLVAFIVTVSCLVANETVLAENPHVYRHTVDFHRRKGNQGHFYYSKL